jgi:hypothetical protein
MGADLLRIDPPAARHAEMEDERVAAVGFDQPVFGAAPEAVTRAQSALAQGRAGGKRGADQARRVERDDAPV